MITQACLCMLRLQKVRLEKAVDEQTKALTDVVIVLEEFDIESNSRIEPQPFFVEKQLSLVPLIPYMAKDEDVPQLVNDKKELEGAVCYYKGDNQSTIDGVVRLAAMHKAAAVFVSKYPLISVDVPVFEMAEGLLNCFKSKHWKVIITVLLSSSSATLFDSDQETERESESQFQETDDFFNDINLTCGPVEATRVEKDYPPTDAATPTPGHRDNVLVDKKEKLSTLQQTDEHSFLVEGGGVEVALGTLPSEHCGTSLSGTSYRDTLLKKPSVVSEGRQHSDKKKKTWGFMKLLSKIWSTAMATPSLEEGLESKDGWSQSGGFVSYKSLSKKVRELCESKDKKKAESNLKEFANQVYRLLVETEGSLLHLVIAARLTLTCQTKSTEDLKKETLRQLLTMKCIDENRPSQFDFDDGSWNPGPTIFKFLNLAFMSKLVFGSDDNRLVTLFWFWIDCGLLVPKRNIDWEIVRSQVDEGFRQRAQETMIASLGRRDADMLSFFLCTSLDDCMQTLLETTDDRKCIPCVDDAVAKVLLYWISRRLEEKSNDPDSLRRLWTTIYDFLKDVTLVLTGHKEDKGRDFFITKIVSLSSFHYFNSLQLYVPLVEVAVARPYDNYCERWIEAVIDCISQDMRSKTFRTRDNSMNEIAKLVDSETFKRIQNQVVVESISWVSAKFMNDPRRIVYKVEYLGALHRMFASIRWKVRPEPTLQLLNLLQVAVEKEAVRSTVFHSCIRVAARNPGIFEGSPELIQGIADMVLTIDDGKEIVSKPFDLVPWEYLSTESLSLPNLLLTAILDRLPEVIYRASESISDFIEFYTRVISENPPIILGKIAAIVFCRKFQDWFPRCFPILAKESHEILASVFQCLSHSSLNEDMLINIKECETSVKTLTEQWRQDFDTDRVSGAVLSQILSYCQTDSWSIITDFTKVKLPTIGDIRLKCDEFDDKIASIGHSIILEGTSLSVQDVLKGYNCYVDPSSEIARIFKEYDFLVVRNEDSSTIPKSFGELSMQLCKVRDDADCAQAFRQKHDQIVRLCTYFLRNSSVLFRKAVTGFIGNKVDIDKLADALDCAKESIRSLFSPEATYELVDDAARAVFNADSPLERELSILLKSKDLKITDAGVERFHLISLLTCYEAPLQGFINFCNKARFSFVELDLLFDELKKVSRQLLERKGEPSDILKDLHRILCPRLGGVSGLKEARQEMQLRQPVLHFMSSLSMNIEVWILAREMDWVGKDGIKRFNDEYANITNVLLGSTETYEMKILDSLGTTIPAVAVLGSLTNAETLENFLDQLEGNDDILRCRVDGDLSDLKQVQCNVSLIRDWFTHGIDEVSAVHVVLEAVKASGEYHLTKVEKNVGKGASSELVLRYTITKDGSQVATSMGGKILSNFVQNLGLIQHDGGEFIEQYRVIALASQHYIEVAAAGYSNFRLESFRCRAGSQWLPEAQELLACTEAKASEFDLWMRMIRQTYPTALLFWNEELRELHQHVLAIADDHKDGYKDVDLSFDFIRQMASRLISVQCPEKDEQLALESVLRLFSQDATRDTEGWLVAISRFVEQLHSALGSPTRNLRQGIGQEQVAEIVLHTIDCGADVMNLAIQVLMQRIYRSRLPEEYEVLDCIGNHVSSEKLSIFLDRSLMFPGSTFLLLHADDLEGRLMEKLLSFLSCHDTACAGVRFHCVQRQSSILHTAPWVEGKSWDSISLDIPTLNFRADLHPWRQLVADRTVHLSIVYSENSGSGKSRYILNQCTHMQSGDGDARIASITLHEGTTIHSLTSDLISRFPPGTKNRVVHFSFMYMPKLHSGSVRWLEDVNHFFFTLLVLGCVHDPSSPLSFRRGKGAWQVFVELPYVSGVSAIDWLWHHIPVLAFCGSVHEPTRLFAIDEEARRVCTYLRAYDNGTINRKFTSSIKQIMFVLDVSGSMARKVGKGKSALTVAKKNALDILNSHIHPGDTFGVLAFDHNTHISIPSQRVLDEDHKKRLCRELCRIQVNRHGRTNMYHALQHAVTSMQHTQDALESWIICLTDGHTADTDHALKASLTCSPPSLHVVVVGVRLRVSYEAQMRLLCSKYKPDQVTKGFFVPTAATLVAMNQAFQTVASRIPVSQTFQFDGRMSDDDCHVILAKYAPLCLPKGDMLLQKFWIRFLYRRVKVFDENQSFNYNEEYDELGSSLMETMLSEVERLLETHQSRDWVDTNHTQLIYDFSSGSPEFRLICTSPETLDVEVRQKLERLKLPGFFIPTSEQLRQRNTLDRFLSQALGIPLDKLRCIDDNGFILTLDFTMKMLNIHERVACRVPCIIEGETGVSKTALTKMYSILRNSSLQVKAEASTEKDLRDICRALTDDGHSVDSAASALGGLHHVLHEASELTIGNETDVAGRIHHLIMEKCQRRSALFRRVPTEFDVVENSKTKSVVALLNWFGMSQLEHTFFEVNVDASLTETDIVSTFEEIRSVARKLLDLGALVVVFLDEINTSSVMGLFKEIVVDKSLRGEDLEVNIVVIAACNPIRTRLATNLVNMRENDLGKDWASGHYQVTALPPSMEKLKWAFGALNKSQENEFVFRRLEKMVGGGLNQVTKMVFTEVITESHEAMRTFAQQNILDGLKRTSKSLSDTKRIAVLDMEADACSRAKSVVSLRDIQRVFSLYEFFTTDFKYICDHAGPERGYQQNAMLLAIATVYYLRLDSKSRGVFLDMMRNLLAKVGETLNLQSILESAMDVVVDDTEIPKGIAVTRGLKENVFVTLVCSLSQIPLLIIGPPGSSKTLSVNVVSDNANGEDSAREFYRQFAQLSVFHYQCSKQSTSREIATVFEKATQRQEKVDAGRHRCVVFMDEAGLPEEERESLKVLHYLLEGHMSAKPKVGFIGISNHALDAAKTNRCITLLRQEPDEEEMISITTGVLFGSRKGKRVDQVKFGESLVDAVDFSSTLSSTYTRLLHDEVEFNWFETFFGLRDYIFFLKALRMRASVEALLFTLSPRSLVFAIERNFNGIEPGQLYQICFAFLMDLTSSQPLQLTSALAKCMRHPIDVLAEATTKDKVACEVSKRARFKLIIDCTDDDSIMRLLGAMGVVDLTSKSLFMLSQMPEEKELEQLKVVSGVRFSAQQGKLAVMSQTEEVNECFYDLFNQHFRAVKGRSNEVLLFANIAVGGVSRRSLVRQEFACVVHVRESRLNRMPAPFLNRFEKYRLRTSDVLSGGCRLLGNLSSFLFKAREQVARVASVLDQQGLFGFVDEQTVDSLFIGMLPKRAFTPSSIQIYHANGDETSTFADCLLAFISQVISQPNLRDHIEAVIVDALVSLPADLSNLLQQLLSKSTVEAAFFLKCIGSLVSGSCDGSKMVKLLGALLQTVATRMAAFRLMQIATPESVFCRRNELPADLVREYFNQEHFSLKRLIANAEHSAVVSKDTRMLIVSTRSDAVINRIPSYSIKSDNSIEITKAVVHDNPDLVVVEHLDALKSESRLRSSLRGWIDDARRSVYVLIINMGDSGAVGRTNFVRMFLEQTLEPGSGKVVVLLLHFPQSSGTSYPALYLGRWQHYFLDGIGQIECNAGVDKFIKAACLNENGSEAFGCHDDRKQLQDIAERLESVLPRVLSHVAAKKILHPDQLITKNFKSGHSARYDFLSSLMTRHVGGQTVGKLLCEKFGRLWLRSGLNRTIQRASEKLRAGSTNLSLSMSLLSSLLETFDTFVSLQLCEMNCARNLDIMFQDVVNQECEELFGLVLRNLPVVPFDELVLHRHDGCVVRGLLVAESCERKLMVFPFFNFIASCLFEVVEAALKDLFQGLIIVKSDIGVDEYCRALYARSYELLHVEESDQSVQIQRRKSAFQAVEFVRSTGSKKPSLFSSYVVQFIEKIVGTMESPLPNDWLRSEVVRLGFEQDVLAIHVVCKVQEAQLLSLASWSTRIGAIPNCSFELNAKAEGGQRGYSFFSRLLDYLEASLFDLSRQQWKSSFSLFFHESGAMLAHNGVLDERRAKRMRALCFFFVVANGSTSDGDGNVLRHWYDTKSRALLPMSLEHLSLFDFAEVATEGGCNEVIQISLWLFFSPTWMKLTTFFRDDDFKFLIEMISSEELVGSNHHMSVSLLRNAFSSFGASTIKLFGLQSQPLQLVANTIATSTGAEFSEDGDRISVSHFIPDWLQRPNNAPDQAKRPVCRDSVGVFLADCTPCFRCELSRVVFAVMVRGCLEQTESWTSDMMLLSVLDDIEVETGCNRQEFTRLARMRTAGGEWESFKGTPVASIGITARLVCFVAKVAQELACTGQSSAMSRPHFETSSALIEGLMSVDFLRWDDFFIGTISRLRGEGTLAKLLKPDGALGSFDWCRKWAHGEPALVQGFANQLAKAERDLTEAISDEERKVQEFRLCPHCSREFIVDAQNCGRFVCGRDFHSRSQPVGCGREFQIDQAPRYTADERVLAPLRGRIQRERTRLQASQEGAVLWTRARNFVVLDFHAVKSTTVESMVPTAYVIPPHETVDDGQATSHSLFRLLESSSTLAEKLTLLPDLIEFYLWLHSTFKHIVTSDRAFSLEMDDVATKERLRCRFDLVHADHIESLWRRLKERFDQLLESMEYKVRWQCQELSVPFKKLEDARLIQLLSEGDDPSEGNDYLFLVINDIIDQYNTFIRRLSELELGKNESLPEVTIHPKFVIPGYGGASLISAVPVLSRFELNTLVEAGWSEAVGAFDMDLLRKLLQQRLFLDKLPPTIKNPMTHLREKFVFRDDIETNPTCHQVVGGVSRNTQGDYFANMQDFTLYNDVATLLREFDLLQGNGDFHRTFQDHFYNFSYDQLRSCLEGVRNVLQMLHTAGATSIHNIGEALCRAMNFTKENLAINSKFVLGQIGFPAFSNPQKQLILSLSAVQLVDLVDFVGHQLATEAYVFASLPLCLTEPLSESDRILIIKGLLAMKMEESIAKTEERLAEFVQDVLRFYESEICKKAMSSGQRLRAFLLEMNCCDESDAIFKLLPRDLTVRNYIALRQLFHQAKLEMRFNDEANAKTEPDGIAGDNGVAAKEAVSWLWNEEHDGRNSQVATEPSRATYADNLWFEATTTTTANNEAHNEGGSEIQARKIQRWWRQVVTDSRKHGCFSNESKAFGVPGQGGHMEWEAFSKKDYYEFFPAMNIACSGDDHEQESVMSSWTYESLYHGKSGGDDEEDDDDNGGKNASWQQLYGSTQEEVNMRRWLNDHKVPQSVGDYLVSKGVREIDDIALFLEEGDDAELKAGIASLDLIKLKRAVRPQREMSPTSPNII